MKFSDMAPERPDGAKHAALLVHALAASDRDWLLSQLPVMQWAELQRLVAELDEMGIAQDQQAFQSMLSERDSSVGLPMGSRAAMTPQDDKLAVDGPSLGDVDFFHALTDEEVDELAEIWSTEPPLLVALALGAHEWPWATRLLERMPALHKRRIEDAMSRPQRHRPSLFVEAVLQSTRNRLSQVRGRSTEPDDVVAGVHGSDHRQRHFENGVLKRTAVLNRSSWITSIADGVQMRWRRLLSPKTRRGT